MKTSLYTETLVFSVHALCSGVPWAKLSWGCPVLGLLVEGEEGHVRLLALLTSEALWISA